MGSQFPGELNGGQSIFRSQIGGSAMAHIMEWFFCTGILSL
jgi:hypothetical protein